ncbi:hypothetical protein DPMN_005179 [Dreissena polymorpha]|uniref:Uncharacterized protein n=1 Tax=Dreissena polymorpha TaxID=45954 RepID=A0A9D4MPV4_DREPO|nr:hypothetical protein DPMN_005179 [Dreissena polymorpha]
MIEKVKTTDNSPKLLRDALHTTEKQSFWNRIWKAFANSLDPDERPQNMVYHQDPNCKFLDAFRVASSAKHVQHSGLELDK